jgi:hypothetical protein
MFQERKMAYSHNVTKPRIVRHEACQGRDPVTWKTANVISFT